MDDARGAPALKEVELSLLSAFIGVCAREGLRWYAMFGTLLGAARHGGFIPWDDDVDVAMPRADYDRLRSHPEWFPAPLFLQTPGSDPAAAPRFARLRMDGTTAFPMDFPDAMTRGGHLGVGIDILPLDDVPGDDAEHARLRVTVRAMHRQLKASAALDEYAGADMPSFKALLCARYGGLPGCYAALAERCERVSAHYRGMRHCAIPALGGARGMLRFEKAWFDGHAELDFEGLRVSVPPKWREVLDACYPGGTAAADIDDDERERGHFWFVDTAADYRAHLWRFTDMLKGMDGKRVILFGAGDSLRIWLARYGLRDRVICALDNAPAKWGTRAHGIPVRPPHELPALLDGDTRLIIASLYHREIGAQLAQMGINDYYVFVDGWDYRED